MACVLQSEYISAGTSSSAWTFVQFQRFFRRALLPQVCTLYAEVILVLDCSHTLPGVQISFSNDDDDDYHLISLTLQWNTSSCRVEPSRSTLAASAKGKPLLQPEDCFPEWAPDVWPQPRIGINPMQPNATQCNPMQPNAMFGPTQSLTAHRGHNIYVHALLVPSRRMELP